MVSRKIKEKKKHEEKKLPKMSKIGIFIHSIWGRRGDGEKCACRAKFCTERSPAHGTPFFI